MNYPVYLVPVFWVRFRLVYSLLPVFPVCLVLPCLALSALKTIIWVYVLVCVSLFLLAVCTVTTTLKPNLYFCVVFRVVVQYTCGPLECGVHGHVAGVTTQYHDKSRRRRGSSEKPWRRQINIIKSLFKTTKRRQQRNRRRWHSFNLHKDVYHGRSALFVTDSRATSDV